MARKSGEWLLPIRRGLESNSVKIVNSFRCSCSFSSSRQETQLLQVFRSMSDRACNLHKIKHGIDRVDRVAKGILSFWMIENPLLYATQQVRFCLNHIKFMMIKSRWNRSDNKDLYHLYRDYTHWSQYSQCCPYFAKLETRESESNSTAMRPVWHFLQR